MKKNILFLFLLFLVTTVNAQNITQEADKLMYSQQFEEALSTYLEIEDKNADINYKIGVCYLNIKDDKTRAIPFLEKAQKQKEENNNINYLLGRAYHFNSEFDKAKKLYYKYLNQGGGTASSISETEKQIEYCENAKELLKFPVDVTFENLGKGVNTPFAEYHPFISEDESVLLFNSNRRSNIGESNSDIYFSKVENGIFNKAELLTEMNTEEKKEQIVGLSATGNTAILYIEDKSGRGDLYLCEKDNGKFGTPVKLDKVINSRSSEIAACITKDENSIFFASNRSEGIDLGGTDLYISVKLPIGGWGYPQNLGPKINTPFDEDFPSLSPDGKTLYFSSNGHTSMGGYDIFKAEWSVKNTGFGEVTNLGYPINTPYDDMNFRLSKSGKFGYISAIRPEGFGGLDLYRVNYNNIDSRFTVIKGEISSANNQLKIEDVMITVNDNVSGDLYGTYLPNLKSKRFVIILPPGDFNIEVEAEGYKMISENIDILDKSSFQAEINKDFILKK